MTDMRQIIHNFFAEMTSQYRAADRLIERLEQAKLEGGGATSNSDDCLKTSLLNTRPYSEAPADSTAGATSSLSYDDGLRRGAEIADRCLYADNKTIARTIRAEIGKPTKGGDTVFLEPVKGATTQDREACVIRNLRRKETAYAIEAVEKLKPVELERFQDWEQVRQRLLDRIIKLLRSLSPEPAHPDPVEVIKKHIAALTLIRLSDWQWEGGGSPIRITGEFSRSASSALGLEADQPTGWPSAEEHKAKSDAIAVLREIEPARQDSEVAG